VLSVSSPAQVHEAAASRAATDRERMPKYPEDLASDRSMRLSAVIRKEGDLYASWCPELDIASQWKTEEEALSNLKEAVELYLEDEDAAVPDTPPVIKTFEVEDGMDARARRGKGSLGAVPNLREFQRSERLWDE